MWWLCCVDFALPVCDLVYITGILVIYALVSPSNQSCAQPVIEFAKQWAGDIASFNEDADSDYYDDDSNFGGREKRGKGKGKTPRNNQKQNKQFRDATKKILDKDQQRALHNEISGEGFGFHEIVEAAKNLWFLIIGLFDIDD